MRYEPEMVGGMRDKGKEKEGKRKRKRRKHGHKESLTSLLRRFK